MVQVTRVRLAVDRVLTACLAPLLPLLLMSAFVLLQCVEARADGIRIETWASVSAEGKLTPDLGIQVTEDARYSGGGIYYNATDLGFTHRSMTYFDSSAMGYRVAHVKKGEQTVEENRLYANANCRWNLGSVGIEDRPKIEYQLQGSPSSRWRISNRLQVSHPLRVGPVRVRIYVSNEITLNTSEQQGSRVVKNQTRAGLSGHVGGNLWMDVFLQSQWTRKNSNDEGVTKEMMEAFGLQVKWRL